MQVRVNISVIGYVQGVGYRFFCSRKAEQYSITGYAKNLVDGSVFIAAEGEKALISEFIKDLKTGPINASVKKVMAEELPYENEFTDFKIH
jgi:acylphosphatase